MKLPPTEKPDEENLPAPGLSLGERFAANTRAQLELAKAVSEQTDAIQRRDNKLWAVMALAGISLALGAVDVWQTNRLAHLEDIVDDVGRNARNINTLTTNINDFVEQIRIERLQEPEPVDRQYIEDQLVPLVVEATLSALEARDGAAGG